MTPRDASKHKAGSTGTTEAMFLISGSGGWAMGKLNTLIHSPDGDNDIIPDQLGSDLIILNPTNENTENYCPYP